MAEKSIRGVPVSHFSQLKLLPLTNCSKKSTLLGIRLPNGSIVVSPFEGTNFSGMKTYAEIMGGEVVNVTGVWHFEPECGENSENVSSSEANTDN